MTPFVSFSNFYKFTGSGGSVDVTCTTITEEGQKILDDYFMFSITNILKHRMEKNSLRSNLDLCFYEIEG